MSLMALLLGWTEQAMESEWVEIGDKHYCPDCYEFDDELDEYVHKKK